MNIAFIGLGVMGGPMAQNLARKGHRVAVYDVMPKALEPFAACPCRIAASPADAAKDADIVMTMLPDSSHVEQALTGKDGACEKLRKNGLIIDLSTIGVSASLAIHADVTRRGFRMIDAPVGRTPRDAVAGTLLVIVGGDPVDIDEAHPIFDCIGNEVVHAGARGCGIKLKLVNNYMSTVGTVLTAEALTLANKVGLDRDLTVRVLSSTTAGRGQLLVNYPKKVLAGDISADFPLRMAHKDVSHALALGAEHSAPLMLGAIAREMFALAKPWGRDSEDWTAMLLLLEDISRADHLMPSSAAQAARN
ncbi:MAG: NAD-binding protein [Methylobacteriaceae bacterium]|nr:NAD-binding protein [Methylobacteriaceae bacterium]